MIFLPSVHPPFGIEFHYFQQKSHEQLKKHILKYQEWICVIFAVIQLDLNLLPGGYGKSLSQEGELWELLLGFDQFP